MKSPICDMLGIEFPLLAFSHCRDVVAAVSRAGGFGVLGATSHSPESIELELKWIDDHVDGKPYGLDVLIPENISTAGEKDVTWKSLEARISPEHRAFTRNLLKKYGIELTTTSVADNQPQPFDAQRALEVLEASFRHPIRSLQNFQRALRVERLRLVVGDTGRRQLNAVFLQQVPGEGAMLGRDPELQAFPGDVLFACRRNVLRDQHVEPIGLAVDVIVDPFQF